MGEFKDASLWMRLAFLMTLVGFAVDMFGYAAEGGGSYFKNGNGNYGGEDALGLLIAGYIFFLAAAVFILALIFLDECKDMKPLLICFIIVGFLAGILTIIGVAVWGGRGNNGIGQAYSAMLLICASLLILLGAIFGVLEIAGVKK